MGEKNQNLKYQNELSKDEVIEVLKKHLNASDFTLEDYVIVPASENPMGFMGVHLKIKANVTVNNDKKEFIYFVKKIPTEVPQHLEYALKTRAFYKEIEAYKTLFEDLKNAQKDPKKRTKWCPDFYYSRKSEIFVIEDLKLGGYYMHPERTLMDEDHIKAVLRTLAAMHAANFVFEEKYNRKEMKSLSPNVSNVGDGRFVVGDIYPHLVFESEATDEPGHPGLYFYETGIKSQVPIVDFLPGYTDAEKERIKAELPAALRRIFEVVKPSSRFKNIFIHADLWSNNMMFKKGADGKVENALLVDFQMLRYGPPGQDVMMLLPLVQNQEFLDKNRDELIKYYYDRFTEELAKNDLSAESILPWKSFLESTDYYYEYAAITSVTCLQLILTPSDVISDFLSTPELFEQTMSVDRTELVKKCFLNDEIYRNRLTEAMNDVIKHYILNK